VCVIYLDLVKFPSSVRRTRSNSSGTELARIQSIVYSIEYPII
jgi:hypothetical protein